MVCLLSVDGAGQAGGRSLATPPILRRTLTSPNWDLWLLTQSKLSLAADEAFELSP